MRDWFNPELRSADAIVPGVIAMVMTMAGTLLTAGGVSREWEHGTMESMLASPAHLGELILARLGCNFALGIGSMLVSLLLAVFLFGVPFRGGLLALAAAVSLFLVFALGWGLFISTLARNQFVASQMAFLTTMMPALMLSGMVFDIAAMPQWLRLVTYLVPARYLVSILQTLFLAGDVWAVLLPNLAALAVAATLAVAGTVAGDAPEAGLSDAAVIARSAAVPGLAPGKQSPTRGVTARRAGDCFVAALLAVTCNERTVF